MKDHCQVNAVLDLLQMPAAVIQIVGSGRPLPAEAV